ncbi:hypothetical protein JRQ81_015810 [Phrynocephalus forsythii]|uniref:Uncharacterized protein n=1 Tax=Phrynocephalus forsythii TaxID=171643 RepID=A0A9Q0XVA0_9SAUR|nr:hypothetical protein JRQ81_015810 [Phrynocephalus forsythii]
MAEEGLEKRIFTICGSYRVIRTALRRRGWAERKHITKSNIQDHTDDGNETEHDNITKTGGIITQSSLGQSRLVRNEETSFYWTIKKDVVDYYNLHVDQMKWSWCIRAQEGEGDIELASSTRSHKVHLSVGSNRCIPLGSGPLCLMDSYDFRKTAAACIVKWVVNLHILSDKYKWLCRENTSKEDSTGSKGILQRLNKVTSF